MIIAISSLFFRECQKELLASVASNFANEISIFSNGAAILFANNISINIKRIIFIQRFSLVISNHQEYKQNTTVKKVKMQSSIPCCYLIHNGFYDIIKIYVFYITDDSRIRN